MADWWAVADPAAPGNCFAPTFRGSGGARGAMRNMTLIRRILVPCDFSPSAHAALSYACGLAQAVGEQEFSGLGETSRRCGPEVTLLHVYPERHTLSDTLFGRSRQRAAE